MNRRKFFGFVAAAPIAVAAMPQAGLASGGMVMGQAAGRLHTIGERCSETIMPLHRMQTLSVKLDEGEMARALRRIQTELEANLVRLHESTAPQAFVDGDGI